MPFPRPPLPPLPEGAVVVDFPRGVDWECMSCLARYPEDGPELDCTACGGILVRIVAEVLTPPKEEP